jgi:DNA-binding LacI/PurR family transcriptional regulator
VVKLIDVARAANVAVSTASRALHNPNRVNVKTRTRVEAAAAQLGYSTNMAARNLRIGTSRMVMVIMPPWRTSPILNDTLRGIDEELSKHGYTMIVGQLNKARHPDPRLLELARGGMVDGAIAIVNEPLSSGGLPILAAERPIIGLMIDLSEHGVPSVLTNERQAVFDAVSRLIARGRKRFMYISGPKDSYHDNERYAGFQEALRKGAPKAAEVLRFEGDFSYDAGWAAGGAFLAMKQRPDAVISCSDDMAVAFMKRSKLAGVSVPQEVCVVGFDGLPSSAYFDPPLSTIQQPAVRMGAASAKLLLRALSGSTVPLPMRTYVKSSYVERESTLPTAKQPPGTAAAG